MQSIWRKQTTDIVPQCNDKNTKSPEPTYDVIIIGAGLAGLLIAYYLKEEGKSVLVLEAKTIASGQTEGTTAKITSQHGIKYSKLIKSVGVEKARLYAQANEAAICEYEQLIQKKEIDCQFKRVSAYLYTTEDEEELKDEARAAEYLGIDATFVRTTELLFPISGAVKFRHQAQFSPLEFVKAIVAELDIREQEKVTSIRKHQVVTEKHFYNAERIVVATHYPIKNVPGFYFMRQHQEKSYVLALTGCAEIDGMYYGVDADGHSFRQAGEYLLFGGESHRIGKMKHCEVYETLEQKARQYYPNCKVEAHWSAQDCMPHDGIPFIGRYSIFTPDLYVVTGFQKWGMTTSMIAAMMLRDELSGRKSPYKKLFSPQRINLKASFGNALVDMGMSIKGLFKGWILRKKPRCSHMGCALTWNPDEQTWDCPCHGSRYDRNGNLIDNPAKSDIELL